jgi:large subunit ribosomal protein L30
LSFELEANSKLKTIKGNKMIVENENTTGKMLKVTLIKSPIRSRGEHKDTIRSLGLRRLHQTHTLPDNPAVRGMIKSVMQWVKVEEL